MITNLPNLSETVRLALFEDIGTGDITTQSTVDPAINARGYLIAKAEGVIAGLPVVEEVFAQIDPELHLRCFVKEGSRVAPQTRLCEISGRAQGILIGERVALNFLQRLSGIATKTARMVSLVEGTRARIVDTRKTTPGLRALEKYAVRQGGGSSHRFGLYDAVMIKDNHIVASGGITQAVRRVVAQASHTVTITVECDTLEQVEEAVGAGADILLLDNMSLEDLRDALEIINGHAIAEASGGVSEETVRAIAETGVDIISVGGLTHSAISLDISLDLTL